MKNFLTTLIGATGNGLNNNGTGNELNNFQNNIKKLFDDFVGYIVGILSALIVAWAIYCGVRYISAKNNEQNKEAKRIITQFIIGIVAVFVLAALGTALVGFLGNWYETA